MSLRNVGLPRQSGYSILELVVVVGIIGVISAIAVPQFGGAIQGFRLSGDARSVSNAAAVAKMRAASKFTHVRLYVDLSTRAHEVQWLDQSVSPAHWTAEGGWTYLSSNVSFGFGVVSAPPPSTQATIGQAPQCTDDTGVSIGNTACFVFNSRGVPIDATSSPTAADAVYLTDGTAVYGVTAVATGMIRLWRTLPVATPAWVVN